MGETLTVGLSLKRQAEAWEYLKARIPGLSDGRRDDPCISALLRVYAADQGDPLGMSLGELARGVRVLAERVPARKAS